LDPENLQLIGKVCDAFKAAGFLDSPIGPISYETSALRQFYSVGYPLELKELEVSDCSVELLEGAAVIVEGTVREPSLGKPTFGFSTYHSAAQRLRELRKVEGVDSEALDDERSMIRLSLKGMGLIADDTPRPVRQRFFALVGALALGDPYPEPAKAIAEEVEKARGWIRDLEHEEVEARENATRRLSMSGEGVRPLLIEALRSESPEVRARAKLILGIGHQPWRKRVESPVQEAPVNPEPSEEPVHDP
jgi:hypothetical protein